MERNQNVSYLDFSKCWLLSLRSMLVSTDSVRANLPPRYSTRLLVEYFSLEGLMTCFREEGVGQKVSIAVLCYIPKLRN